MGLSLEDSAERLQVFPEERFDEVTPIGEGGNAVVFEAVDRNLGRKVAIKLSAHDALPATLLGLGEVQTLVDEARAAQGRYTLLREARMLACVDHPNVVAVIEVGRLADGAVAVIMPLLEGGALAAREPEGHWRDELQIALEIGEGLAAIHEAGLLHRDLKPENVLFDRRGRPRIADLGLACERTDEDALAERVGTPHYMSPEVLAGERFDVRDEVYAFCFLVFEQFYGYEPFASTAARLRGSVSHIYRPGGVPRRFRQALVKGLHPCREQRWQDMRALLRELRQLEEPARRHRWVAAGGVALAIALAGILASTRPARAEACEQVVDELSTSWGAEVEAELRGVFGTRKLGDALQSWASRWVRVRALECERARRGGESSRASPCAARMRERFGATVETFRAPHRREGLRFAAVVAELPMPEHCLEHPEDREYADGGLLALREVDVEIGALIVMGELEAARSSQARYMELARAHASAFGLARASYWDAQLRRLAGELDAAEALLEEVYAEAELLGAVGMRAEAMLALARIAAERGDLALLDARAFAARAVFERHEPERVARVLQVHGLALIERPSERARGLRLLVEAVERSEAQLRRYGGSRDPLSQARESLGRGMLAAGRFVEAGEVLERALVAHREEFGSEAPRLHDLHMLMFEVEVGTGRLARAHLVVEDVLHAALQRHDAWAIVRDAEHLIRVSVEHGHLQFALELHDLASQMLHAQGLKDELAPLGEELRQLMVSQ